jgi:hypothetical protein
MPVGENSNSCFGLLQQVMKSAGKEWVLGTVVSITLLVTYIFNFMKRSLLIKKVTTEIFMTN